METGSELLLAKKKKKIIIKKCFKVSGFIFYKVSRAECDKNFNTFLGNIHVETEHFWLKISGYFVNT